MTVPITSHCTFLRTDASTSNGTSPSIDDGRAIVFFDIDNTLYSKSTGISEVMQDLIQRFFESMGWSKEEATEMHSLYYKEYGLSVRGLIRHHAVDPLVYDAECDGKLPLDRFLSPSPALRALLQRVDRSKCRLWALTNAYVHHARRVLRLLDVDDLFEAVISCDYAHPTFRCKPELEYYRECEVHTGIGSSDRFYLVDDSGLNVAGARQAGWNHAVLFDEDGTEAKKPVARGIPTEAVVSRLEELVDIWGDAVFLPAAAAKG